MLITNGFSTVHMWVGVCTTYTSSLFHFQHLFFYFGIFSSIFILAPVAHTKAARHIVRTTTA